MGLKFLVSGPGLIGRKHINLILNNDRSELSAIVAPLTKQNLDFAQSVSAPIFSTVNEAIENSQTDAAIVCSPNLFHFEQASQLINKNIPTLVEKPITDELQTAYMLTQLSEKTGCPILVGHHRTYSPQLEEALAFIKSSQFGNPVSMNGSALFYKPEDYFEEGPWRTQMGGGPILINLIHEIGIWRLVFGEISAVSAVSSSHIRNFQVEDSAGILIEFKNGAIGTFNLSDAAASNMSWELSAGENPMYPFYSEANPYHFAGSNGSLNFPSMNALSFAPGQRKSWTTKFVETRLTKTILDPLKFQLDHFIDVIEGRGAPLVSARDGFMNLLILEAIRESISTRRAVSISDFAKANGIEI